jgi:hypothetical protein
MLVPAIRYHVCPTAELRDVVLSAGEGPLVLRTAILAAMRAVRRTSLNLLGHSRLARLDVVVHTEEVRRIVLIL